MIYSIAGVQGQGKSEAISFFQEESFLVIPMKKTSDSSSIENFKLAQEQLVYDKLDAINNAPSGVDIIMESSFIDVFVYSLMLMGVHYDHSIWLDKLYERCCTAQQAIELTIMFPFTDTTNISMNKHAAESFQILSMHYHKKCECVMTVGGLESAKHIIIGDSHAL